MRHQLRRITDQVENESEQEIDKEKKEKRIKERKRERKKKVKYGIFIVYSGKEWNGRAPVNIHFFILLILFA
jgi:hypothetical protein